MTIPTSEKWNPRNLSHRYTVSFFKSKYGDDPKSITSMADFQNKELTYFNIADPNNEINAVICAGLLVDYIEVQGIPYHEGRLRKDCFSLLSAHLKEAEGRVLYTADIIDYHFKFLGEKD
jgi:hypothetical protein